MKARRVRAAAVRLALFASSALVLYGGSPGVMSTAWPRALAADEQLISRSALDSVVAVIQREIARKTLPGAALAAGHRGRISQLAGVGSVGSLAGFEAARADVTMYDLASLTKAVATTTAVLLLVQDGRIGLDEPMQRWLPGFTGKWKDSVTWRHLLTHTSGLPPAGRMRGKTPGQRLRSLIRTELVAPPSRVVMYSDLGFILLWEAAQRVAGEPLPRYLERRVWRPLGMSSTAFWPGLDCERCAPTLTLKSGEPYRGKPADPIAHELGVPSGNAGLFSTAHDLGLFAAMIANGGALGDARILREDLVRELFRQHPNAGQRTLGWEAFCPAELPKVNEPCRKPVAFGHTGFTGTSLWIDPSSGVWVVLLSNRRININHPPSLMRVRQEVFTRVANVISDASPATHADE